MRIFGILMIFIGIATSIAGVITRDDARSEFWGASYVNRDTIADAEMAITIGIVVAVVGILLLLAYYITSKNNNNNKSHTNLETKVCLKCGNIANINQKFCGKCGNDLENQLHT